MWFLLVLMLALGASAELVRYVRPKDAPLLNCPAQPCLTLEEYKYSSAAYPSTGSTFVFLAGNHSLDYAVSLANVSDVVFRGEKGSTDVNIICGDRVSILFENVTHFGINGLRFIFNSSFPTSVLVLINSGQVQISNSTFQGTGYLAKGSRAVYSINSTFGLYETAFFRNTADKGGAIRAIDSILVISDSLFGENTATFAGGAISAERSTIKVSNSSFNRNRAQFRSGALDLVNSNASLSQSLFVGNTASFFGGVIRASRSIIHASHSNFDCNRAKFRGGVFDLFEGDVSLFQSVFTGNKVEMQGGVISANLSWIDSTGTYFINNSATIRGGAIYVARSSIILTNDTFTVNHAQRKGGAVYANESILHLLGNDFSLNTVNVSGGNGSAIFLCNSTLYRNETYKNVFNYYAGDTEGPISCTGCRIALSGGNKNGQQNTVPKAHLARFGYPRIISTPSTVAIYSNSKAPGDSFVGIIASRYETKIVLTGNSTVGGEQYLLYSVKNPTALAFFNRRRPTSFRGMDDFINMGKTMKGDFNFYTNLGTAINGQCSNCNLKLMGIGYFSSNNIMPAYYYRA